MRPVIRVQSIIANTSSTSVGSIKRPNVSRYPPTASWVCKHCYVRDERPLFLQSALSWSFARARKEVLKSAKLQRVRSTGRSSGRSYSTDAKDATDSSRDALPSQEEGRRSHLSKRFSDVMDHLQSNIFIAGQRLNDLTGYSGIEDLKKDIEEQERKVQSRRIALQEARSAYSAAISSRSSSQREVNTLLQRKHAWEPADLERFTALYRSDHANEQAEASAREHLTAIEKASEEAAARLSASILARYHEEQIWSDKIRRMSTWGTWGLMGVNVLLFLVFQIGVEPWRRKRLVKGFEEKVVEALDRDTTASRPALNANFDESETEGGGTVVQSSSMREEDEIQIVAPPIHPTLATAELAAPPATPKSASIIEGVRGSLRDMFSERQISVRKVDLTTAMLEGAAAGVTFVGIIVLLLRPR